MSQTASVQSIARERCRAPETCVINHFVDSGPHSSPLCETCWISARLDVGTEMTEGPLVWGQDWAEVLVWLNTAVTFRRRIRHFILSS